jgi:hypothetical protein
MLLNYKKVTWLISNAGRSSSCRESFKVLNEITVPCMYIREILTLKE